jgi:hypothetical protein
MNHQFDELTKSLAQSVTRRAALKKFGVGLAGMALACFGLTNKTLADKVNTHHPCAADADCASGEVCCSGACVPGIPDWCDPATSCCCFCTPGTKRHPSYPTTALPPCHYDYQYCVGICGFMFC